MTPKKENMALYVHIPFCEKKCAYCDFLSAPADEAARASYVEALCTEIREAGNAINADAESAQCTDIREAARSCVSSVFIGGGTPTVLSADQLSEILSAIRESFFIADDAEITVEANPGTVDAGKLTALQKGGVNRLSFGLQSADNEELALLGRIHTWEAFQESYQLARDVGLSNINIDLISAIPGQSADSFERTLDSVIALSPEHLSVYSLILEEGTAFSRGSDGLGRPLPAFPDEDTIDAIDRVTKERLSSAGYQRYEISNYAKPGGSCRHNTGYWTGVPYLGLGLGAVSCLPAEQARLFVCGDEDAAARSCEGSSVSCPGEDSEDAAGIRFRQTTDIAAYLQAGAAGGKQEKARAAGGSVFAPLRSVQEVLGMSEAMSEFFILGLRMTEGVTEAEFERRFGKPAEDVFGDVFDKYEKAGLLTRKNGRIALTGEGLAVSNHILAEFL